MQTLYKILNRQQSDMIYKVADIDDLYFAGLTCG